jgi:hypothetical protein
MNCELMLTYDTPALRQTGSKNLTGQKTLHTIWHTYTLIPNIHQQFQLYYHMRQNTYFEFMNFK